MITLVGVIADAIGAVSQTVAIPYNGAGRSFDVKRKFFATPSTQYRSVQAAEINVDVNHDRMIGLRARRRPLVLQPGNSPPRRPRHRAARTRDL